MSQWFSFRWRTYGPIVARLRASFILRSTRIWAHDSTESVGRLRPSQAYQQARYFSIQTTSSQQSQSGSPDAKQNYTFSDNYFTVFRSLAATTSYSVTDEEMDLISAEYRSILHRFSTPKDTSSRTFNLQFVATLVAPYKALKHKATEPTQICALLKEALRQTLEPLSQQFSQQFNTSSDVFALLVSGSKEKEVHFFGPDFELARSRDDDDGYYLEVRRCWYMKMLALLDASDIGPVFCAFDKSWYEQIDPRKHGVQFSRPQTIASGSDCCHFNFDRVSATQKAGSATS